jgi:hypothetical protein
MIDTTPIAVPPDLREGLDQLHVLYGRDQPLIQIVQGLNTRLANARQIYGPKRSLSEVVDGLLLNQLRQLYGLDQVEELLDGIIERKEQLNRLIELQSKTIRTIHEQEEIQALVQQFKPYVKHMTIDEHEEVQRLMRQFRRYVHDREA